MSYLFFIWKFIKKILSQSFLGGHSGWPLSFWGLDVMPNFGSIFVDKGLYYYITCHITHFETHKQQFDWQYWLSIIINLNCAKTNKITTRWHNEMKLLPFLLLSSDDKIWAKILNNLISFLKKMTTNLKPLIYLILFLETSAITHACAGTHASKFMCAIYHTHKIIVFSHKEKFFIDRFSIEHNQL